MNDVTAYKAASHARQDEGRISEDSSPRLLGNHLPHSSNPRLASEFDTRAGDELVTISERGIGLEEEPGEFLTEEEITGKSADEVLRRLRRR